MCNTECDPRCAVQLKLFLYLYVVCLRVTTISAFGVRGVQCTCPGQLLESGVRSKRDKREVLELKNFKNREISFLTRIFGRMTPIGIFFLFFS